MMKIKQLTQHIIRRGQVGQSIVILALGMIALLGFVGLTTDVSLMFVRYNNLRRAVDSAAIAAAGQVRQGSEDAASDVITRASMAARQFIEFHGLNPRDVWVEMCENQPRQDFSPGQEGLQLEPPSVTLAREKFELAKKSLTDATPETIETLRFEMAVSVDEYIQAIIDIIIDDYTPELDDALGIYNDRKFFWLDSTLDEDWDAYVDVIDPTINTFRQAIGDMSTDLEICSPDVRKLVRVTAQIDSPTVFLRVLGFTSIPLQASAISETALLDVVLIMDVSETMARDTSYEDWSKVNLGMAYVPPFLAGPFRSGVNNSYMPTITNNLIEVGFLPRNHSTQDFVHQQNIDTYDFTRYPPHWGAMGQTGGVNLWGSDVPPTNGRSGSWYEWFWIEYIMSEWPYYINQRLNFLQHNGQPLRDDVVSNPVLQSQVGSNRALPSEQYPVRSFQPTTHHWSTSNHPREECRVRFFPYSFFLDMVNPGSWPSFPYKGESTNIAAYYVDQGQLNENTWSNITNNDLDNLMTDVPLPRWGSFVPTYNFYGCCNDPTTGVYVSDGTDRYRDVYAGNEIIPNGEYVIIIKSGELEGYTRLGTYVPSNDYDDPTYAGFNTRADQNFADLVCQPFKQAKDATRQFLRRIDFLRGDRVAFVTYDRSAFLVNPDTEQTGEAHMIETYERAVDTLDRVIGVRAEPNYYVWSDDDNPRWSGFAAGIDENGNSIPLDFGFSDADININLDITGEAQTPEEEAARADLIRRAGAAATNYPSYNNCSVSNALMRYPYSIYATRNASPSVPITPVYDTVRNPQTGQDAQELIRFNNYAESVPALAGGANPNFVDDQIRVNGVMVENPWRYERIEQMLPPENRVRSDYTGYPRSFQYTYERHTMCAGGNIGLALRAAHSALNDPRTSRRDGAVWIIVLLSDGAVGTTGPVRRNGEKLNSLNPYTEIERFIYDDFRENFEIDATSDDEDHNSNRYGQQNAEYGAYGLCPFGETNFDGQPRLGELITGNYASFPWCSKSDPFERHFCLRSGDHTRPLSMRSVGYNQFESNPTVNAFGPGFQPNSWDKDYRLEIAPSQAAYELELMNAEYEARTPIYVPPIPEDYQFGDAQWLLEQNTRFSNIYDVDLGNLHDASGATNRCDPLYDPYDYARDWADFVTGIHSDDNSNLQLPIIFTIGFGLDFEGDGSCQANIKKCLGEELLRYIADAGDNFQIDNDVHQDMLADRYYWRANLSESLKYPTLNGLDDKNEEIEWEAKDPCEPDTYVGVNGPAPAWRPNDPDNPTPASALVTRPNGSCGNYFNAPSLVELERVFDEIASRMFTRLSG